MYLPKLIFIGLSIIIIATVIYFFRNKSKFSLKKKIDKIEPVINTEVIDDLPLVEDEVNIGSQFFVDLATPLDIEINTNIDICPNSDINVSDLTLEPLLDLPSESASINSNSNPSTIKFAHASDTLIFKIKAKSGKNFMGYELLQTLLDADFRFGEMDIFHYYENLTPKSPAIFSLAAATPSGKFELNSIGGLRCPGLIIFMQIIKQKHLLEVFELMVNAMAQIAEELDGEIYDSEDNLLTSEMLEDIRNKLQIMEEQKQYVNDLLDTNA